MKIHLPLSLRRCLSACLCSLSLPVSGADFVIDVTQLSAPGRGVYQTLAELVASGIMAAGDTVVLNNDDATLVSGLPVLVNFRSNDPETPRTVDLSGLGDSPLFNLSAGNHTLNMCSVVWSNASERVFSYREINSNTDIISVTLDGQSVFKGNYNSASDAYRYGQGGAICLSNYKPTTLIMGDNNTFLENHAPGSGGAIYVHSKGGSILTMGDHSTFVGNYSFVEGGAIAVYGSRGSTVTLGDNAVFTGNYVSTNDAYFGGAISITMSNSNREGCYLTLGANARFTGNYVSGSYKSRGGAVAVCSSSAETGSILTLGDNAIFTGNYAFSSRSSTPGEYGGYGGAIYLYAETFTNTLVQDGATFSNNYATTKGGALYLNSAKAGLSQFLALNRDVLFSGNMTGGTFTKLPDGSFSVENGIANAIHAAGRHSFQFAASEGRQVRFDDPLTSSPYFFHIDPDRPSDRKENIEISLNQYRDGDGILRETGGDIVFSGKLYQGDEAHLAASRYNDFKGQVTLYGGTLVLEHNVVFGNDQLRDDTFMTLRGGTLEITGGSTVNSASFTVAHSDVVLRPGVSTFINADNVDLSHGFSFDIRKQAEEAALLPNVPVSGISISAPGTFALGGSVRIMDTETTANYYYADNSWAQQRTFVILSDVNQTHAGDLAGAYSQATGSDRVDSPYTYTGVWSHQWADADGDGFAEQLQLVWTPASVTPPVDPDVPLPPAPGIRDILPELAGALTMNSMWSSASNAKSVSNAALGAMGAGRFLQSPENNYWFKGLGDFTYHGSMGTVDGYDYNGGGYALGFDRKITDKAILGLAFGNLYGKMSGRTFVGDNRQTSNVGLLYGGWRSSMGDRDTLALTGTAGYGWTGNRMSSFHTGGWSQGKWDNHTRFGSLQGQWEHALEKDWTLDVLLGLEYTDVMQKAFTETGWDARRFEKGALRNLSLPVGLGVGRTAAIGSMPWRNSVSVSYVPDVYRENPHADATRLMNGYGWTAKGVSPDRHAVRAQVNSTLTITPNWTAYAAYEFEGRRQSVYHRVNAGVSCSY